jgi:flagellar FliL protein
MEEKETIEIIEDIGAGEGEKKKKGLPKIKIPPVILYIPFVAIVAVAGYFGYKEFFGVKKAKEEVEVAKVVAKKGIMIPGPSLVVNLADVNVPRFLKVSMIFEVDRGITVAEVNEKEAIIKDAIIGLLASKTMSDIRGYEGQNLLKEELISRINAILETGNVINIYFTEFIVQ